MELKKTESADLNKKRAFFLAFSYVVVLALVIMAFQWESNSDTVANLGVLDAQFEETLEIPQTKQDVPPPPPPQVQQTQIVEVANDEIIQETKVSFDAEITEETQIVPQEIKEEAPAEEVVSEIFLVVEEPQSFPGGQAGIAKFLQDNIRYPEMAKQAGIDGRVFVQFVVNEKGSIDNVEVLKGIGGGCDEEAVRVVKLMKWNPGKQRGKPVKVRMSLPIKFTLG
ncbi:MAG: hypothetical protein A3G23_01990 [Bacteroidetes bacterium RIFCSPLOWO2_12_FULL_37_12]|nr:MAG: hypothetical protein A3G23_01990 [Bacteroidetes bacterium RIFCSPLOWO2_12_FULL_37_12]